MSFILDIRLSDSTIKLYDSALSEVRLKNNKHFPWIILIPRVTNAAELFELSETEQNILMQEITHIASRMQNHFTPTKMNVGMLGNIVRQLHIHIIARYESDFAWPQSVWQAGVKDEPYSADQMSTLIPTLCDLLS